MVRLYIDKDLYDDGIIALDKKQKHYLVNVLRLKSGDEVLAFNGRDGEWLASIDMKSRDMALVIEKQTKKQIANDTGITIAMPIIKVHRLKILVEKATELGVTRIEFIITDRTQIHKINLDSIQAIVIEAAEQCGRIDIPEILKPRAFDKYIADNNDKVILVGDETGGGKNFIELLHDNKSDMLLMVGPEGGWSARELEMLKNVKNIQRIDLGKNILRSETAMIAMISIMSLLGNKNA